MTPEGAAALRAPFPPEQIGKLPKGGRQLDYVGHADTTDRLLSVDPEWTWEPMALTPEGHPALDQHGNLWIRLTILGVTRIGCGDGKSMKECIGDAIRNGAMRFGVALDLWAVGDRQFGDSHDSGPTNRTSRPAPATPSRDYASEAAATSSVDVIREVWDDARRAGDMNEALASVLNARFAELEQPAADPWAGQQDPKEPPA